MPAVPIVTSTCVRASSRLRSSAASAWAARASFSWSNPNRMCSVPMKLWLRMRAYSWARIRTCRAASVKRSNTKS